MDTDELSSKTMESGECRDCFLSAKLSMSRAISVATISMGVGLWCRSGAFPYDHSAYAIEHRLCSRIHGPAGSSIDAVMATAAVARLFGGLQDQ